MTAHKNTTYIAVYFTKATIPGNTFYYAKSFAIMIEEEQIQDTTSCIQDEPLGCTPLGVLKKLHSFLAKCKSYQDYFFVCMQDLVVDDDNQSAQ